MNNKTERQCRQVTLAIAAINHPLRRRIIKIIKAVPNGITSTDIGVAVANDPKLVNINRNKYMVSQHLTILKSANLVTLRVDGKLHFYSANLEQITFINFVRKKWSKLTK